VAPTTEGGSKRRGPKLPVKLHQMACASAWYAPVSVGTKEFDLLVDSGAAKTCLTRDVYNRLPEPRPELRKTNLKFQMANGNTHNALGVCHFPLTLKFGDTYHTEQLPVFVCDFLPADMDGVLGFDAQQRFRMLIDTEDGKLFRKADPSRSNPCVCRAVPRQEGMYKCGILNKVVIPAGSVMTVDVSTRNCGFPKKDKGNLVIGKPLDEFWDDYGILVFQGLVDLNAGPAPMIFVNMNEDDVVLRSGIKVMTIQETHGIITTGKPVQGRGKTEAGVLGFLNPTLNSMYPVDCRKIVEEAMPTSMLNVYPGEGESLTPRQKTIITRLLELRTSETDSESDMSGLEEAMDVMEPPTVDYAAKPLEPGKLPEQVELLLESCRGRISDEQLELTRELLLDTVDSFMDPTKQLIGTDAVAHYIDTGDKRPIRVPPRRIPPGRRKIIEDEIAKMLEQGIIRCSDSPWSSPVVLVKKKDGSTRFCIDYRQLNEVTRKNAYPLPRIDTCLEALKGNSWFCTLDLASGYWQIKMSDEDRCKTAFASHMGLYEFNRMPFGLTNAPATFQCLMERVLQGYIGNKCLLYLDDVIVFGKTFEEVYDNLKAVLARFAKYNLKLKAKKCELFKRKVAFLGHVVSEEGIQCDPKKIEKIKDLDAPTNRSGVRAILGLGNYYRRFIKDYGNIVAPLQRLTRKEVEFEWGDEEQAALDKLKEAFCSAPILAYPDHEAGNFIIDTDASNYAIGGVISQVQNGEERVIAYGSKCLSGSQLRWCTTRRELWAIFYFIRGPFWYYLESDREHLCTLRTDHAALRWLSTMSKTTKDGALQRWLMFLQPLFPKMTITYRKGSEHGNADALSRFTYNTNTRSCPREDCPDEGHKLTRQKRYATDDVADLKLIAPVVTRNQMRGAVSDSDCAVVASFSNEEVKDAQHRDPELSRFIELLDSHVEKPPAKQLSGESSEVRILCSLWNQFKVVDGILYRVGKLPTDTWRLVIPKELRSLVMKLLHDSKWAGHPGMSRMKSSIGSRYFWPRMRNDIESWIKCCRACAMAKRGKGRGRAPLIQEQSGAPFQRVAFDVIGPLPITKFGKRFILVMVDYYTKWAEAYDLADHTAITVAQTIVTRWVSLYGTPLRLHCDNAPEFRGHVLRQMRDLLGVRGTFSSPYRPKSNGLCERTNQTIEGILRSMIRDKRNEWDQALPFAMMAYRATPQTSTSFTPNMLVFGRENIMPADIMFGQTGMRVPHAHDCYCEYVDWLRKAMVDSYVRARYIMGLAAERQKACHDEDTAPRHFKVGDWVLHYHKPSGAQTLNSGWTGPWVVVQKLSEVNYIIRQNRFDKEKVAHCDEMQPDIYPNRGNWIRDELARRKEQAENERRGRQNVTTAVAQTQTETLPLSDLFDKAVGGAGSTSRPVETDKQQIRLRRSSRLAQKALKMVIRTFFV